MTHPRTTTLPLRALGAMTLLATAATAPAQDWSSVPIIQHSTYQAVNVDGSSVYDGTFPIRLRGVVLNNNEDWLDPTADYDPDGYNFLEFGGQAEIFVQAVDLDGTTWDPDPGSTFSDFGGTAAWMGQNLGNVPANGGVPTFNYTDDAWYDNELDRLGFWRPGSPLSSFVRAGDLIEIRARGGLAFQGKMNVNEQHNNDPALDFELEILQKGYGLPTPAAMSLAELLDPGFDETRQTGPERYQSTLVTLEDVSAVPGSWDASSRTLDVTDGLGHELEVRVGHGAPVPSLSGSMHLTGILNQVSSFGNPGTNGYYLIVVPEPASLVLLGVAVVLGLGRRRRR